MAAHTSSILRKEEAEPPIPGHLARHHKERDDGTGGGLRSHEMEGDSGLAQYVREERGALRYMCTEMCTDGAIPV